MIIGARINLRHLRAFRAVAHHGRFTRAAEAVGVSQPALSALIAQLEEDLGIKLIHRTTRAVELTSVGREFLGSCLRILADFEGAIGDARDYAQLHRGRLRVAALPSISRTVLPGALRAFRDAHPGVTVSVVDLLGDPLIEQVMSGQVDLAVGFAEASTELRVERLLTDQLVAVGALDVLAEKVEHMSWNALADHDVIAMSHGTTVRRLMDEGSRSASVALRIILEPQQMPTAIAYARAGLGIAVLPSTALDPNEDSDVRSVPIVAPIVERRLSLLSRRQQTLPPAAEAFAGMLRQRVSD